MIKVIELKYTLIRIYSYNRALKKWCKKSCLCFYDHTSKISQPAFYNKKLTYNKANLSERKLLVCCNSEQIKNRTGKSNVSNGWTTKLSKQKHCTLFTYTLLINGYTKYIKRQVHE